MAIVVSARFLKFPFIFNTFLRYDTPNPAVPYIFHDSPERLTTEHWMIIFTEKFKKGGLLL